MSTTRVGAFGRADGAENISKRRASRRRSRERTPPARGRGEGGEKTGKSSRARGETHNRRRRRKIARRAPSLARSSREAPASGRRTTDPTRSTPRSRRRRRSSRRSRAPPRRPSRDGRRRALERVPQHHDVTRLRGRRAELAPLRLISMCSAVQAVFLVQAVVEAVESRRRASRAFLGAIFGESPRIMVTDCPLLSAHSTVLKLRFTGRFAPRRLALRYLHVMRWRVWAVPPRGRRAPRRHTRRAPRLRPGRSRRHIANGSPPGL